MTAIDLQSDMKRICTYSVDNQQLTRNMSNATYLEKSQNLTSTRIKKQKKREKKTEVQEEFMYKAEQKDSKMEEKPT